jgi:dihydroxyacetone kinase DhaKLM complex PTS-EIIA-like component DhaM
MQIKSFKSTRDVALDMSEYVADGEDATLNVTFVETALTPAMQMKMQEDPENVKIVVESMVELLAKWDLKDGGKTVPITFDSLAALPVFFLGAIFEKITEAVEAEEGEAGKG